MSIGTQTAKQTASIAATGEFTQLLRQGIRIERKLITFDLRENPRGKFLRITEDVGGRRNAIIVPLSGLEEFRDSLNEVVAFSKGLRPKQ